MSGPSILGLHHAQITVPRDGEAQARAFYIELLGLRELPKPEPLASRGGFWLELGDRQVHVGLEDGVTRAGTRSHLAYEVDDLQAWRRWLAEHGVLLEDGAPIPGFVRAELRDPCGNRVELLQRVSGAGPRARPAAR